MYVSYPHWIGLILYREESYVEIHGITIHIPALSSKIINTTPTTDDLHIIVKIQKWIEKPYVVESYESEEENDEDNDEEGTNNGERGDEEEDSDKDEEESIVDKGEDFAQGMNSPPRMNKHIRFSTTSSSTSSAYDVVQSGSIPPFVETAKPMIQDVTSPKLTSPSPHAEIVPPIPTPIQTVDFYQGESNSNFQTAVFSQLSLIVQITQSLGNRLSKVERDVAEMKHFLALVDDDDDDDDDMVVDDTLPNSPEADDHPIPDTGDQSETDDYEGFLDLGDVPQGTNNDIDYDNDHLNPRKRKLPYQG
ncbi:unnamed protein product [Lactuca saligna]|uniref:Uncharacterized protein n=1 Tax=Lactuca saligna TaxID=75948 RepID=A0AA36E2J1_LACSI|nr:unnamed protein product [Lactuca saligna]